MGPDELRLKADHFRQLACAEADPMMQAELHMLAGEYDATAAQLESSAGAMLSARVTLPNC